MVPNSSEDLRPLTRVFMLSTASVWKEYAGRPFVKELRKRLPDKRCFVRFIGYVERIDYPPWLDGLHIQDYRYHAKALVWVSRYPPR